MRTGKKCNKHTVISMNKWEIIYIVFHIIHKCKRKNSRKYSNCLLKNLMPSNKNTEDTKSLGVKLGYLWCLVLHQNLTTCTRVTNGSLAHKPNMVKNKCSSNMKTNDEINSQFVHTKTAQLNPQKPIFSPNANYKPRNCSQMDLRQTWQWQNMQINSVKWIHGN